MRTSTAPARGSAGTRGPVPVVLREVRPAADAGVAPRAATAPGEVPQLTGLRFVAAAWVLVHHLSFVPGLPFGRWAAPVAPLVAAGPLGVDLFFVLSGLVLTRAYLERWSGAPGPRALGRYLRARVARLWPLYAVVVTGFGLWCLARARFGRDDVVTWQATQPGLGLRSWLAQLTMTQMWPSPGIEGVSFVLTTWSVSAEWLAYLVFPLLAVGAWWLRGWPRPVLAVLAVLAASPIAVSTLAAGAGTGPHAWPWVLRLAGGFVAGMLTWLVVRRLPATPTVRRWAVRAVPVVLAEIVLVAYWAASAPPTAAIDAADRLYLAVPMFPVLLGALCLADRGPARWLAAAPMQHGGRISYALYLVHFPMIEILVVAMTRYPAIGPGTSAAALLVPHVLLATVGVAHLAHRWVEVPLARWGRGERRRDARRATSAPRPTVPAARGANPFGAPDDVPGTTPRPRRPETSHPAVAPRT